MIMSANFLKDDLNVKWTKPFDEEALLKNILDNREVNRAVL